jgi:serine/threonine protein kinase/tetratricopeptide (TPR) repeat protein
MDASSIQLGPFILHEPIARGAAAEVWRGTHLIEGVPVAIKVMGLGCGSLSRMVDRFDGEVRAVASLNHQGVVAVLDHGVVGLTAHRASDRRLPVGAPWLAMEYCSGGTLADRSVGTWPEAHDLLVRILEALAYTHARGVLHRDIKPRNVLFADWGDSRPGVKLTDFGLAMATAPDESMADVTIGTPNYMAPEQVLGHWRAFGPPTDLYGVGCLAWWLLVGTAPFQGLRGGVAARLRAHVQAAVPALNPQFAVPAPVRAWLHRLLAKSPEARFPFAADALAALPHADSECATPAGSPFSPRLEVTSEEDTLETEAIDTASVGVGPTSLEGPLADLRSPVPARWSAVPQPAASMRLIGAGLGLFALRSVALVGREPERAKLWAALHRAAETGRPVVALIEGAAGVGKTRLAKWLTETAHELGAADHWRAEHSPKSGAGEGVGQMLAEATSSVGLSGADLERHLEETLRWAGVFDPYEWHALAELIDPSGGSSRPNLEQPAARYAVIERELFRRASQRSLIVVLDDAVWGRDALRLASYVANRDRSAPFPVMIVLTSRSEALVEHPAAAREIEQLIAASDGPRIKLSALGGRDMRGLVEDLLGMEGDLAATVEARCDGNPLFAVQLIGDWVARGVLEVGKTGFRVVDGADITIPDDVHQLWLERVDNVLPSGSESVDLELAAVLGLAFSERELRIAVEAAGRTLGGEWFNRCGRSGLLDLREQNWHFGHRMLHETMLRGAADGGRLVVHHKACASALESVPGVAHGRAERLAFHRQGCGEYAAAFAGFSGEAKKQLRRGNTADCRALWEEAERTLSLAGTERKAIEWGQLAIGRALLAEVSGAIDRACEIAHRVTEDAKRYGWTEIGLRAEVVFAREREVRGDAEGAEVLLRSVLERAPKRGEIALRSQRLLAWSLIRRGQLDAASDILRDLLATLETLDDPSSLGAALRDLAVIAMQRTDFEDALFLCAEARKAYGQGGLVRGVALANSSTGEIYRMQGRYSEAEQMYRKVRDGMLRLGNDGAYRVADLNIGLALLGQGAFDDAEPFLVRSAKLFGEDGQGLPEMVAHAGLSVVAAVRGEAERVADIGVKVAAFLSETGLVEQDIAWCFEAAAEHLLRNSFVAETAVVLAVAKDQWQALGRADRVAAIAARAPIETAGHNSQQPR